MGEKQEQKNRLQRIVARLCGRKRPNEEDIQSAHANCECASTGSVPSTTIFLVEYGNVEAIRHTIETDKLYTFQCIELCIPKSKYGSNPPFINVSDINETCVTMSLETGTNEHASKNKTRILLIRPVYEGAECYKRILLLSFHKDYTEINKFYKDHYGEELIRVSAIGNVGTRFPIKSVLDMVSGPKEFAETFVTAQIELFNKSQVGKDGITVTAEVHHF